MGKYFTVGEFAKLYGGDFSKQTLIFYDKIGLLKPEYIDENNGYRYYSGRQLEVLDTIFILKEIGVPLEEMKHYLNDKNPQKALEVLREKKIQLDKSIKQKMQIKKRLDVKLEQLQMAANFENADNINYNRQKKKYLYYIDVKPPYSAFDIDIAIREMFEKVNREKIEYNYQIGTIVPLAKLKSGEFLQAYRSYTVIDKNLKSENTMVYKEGLYATFYHRGAYAKAGETYEKALKKIAEDGYEIIGDSFEECIIDNLATNEEDDYLTKFSIPVKKVI